MIPAINSRLDPFKRLSRGENYWGRQSNSGGSPAKTVIASTEVLAMTLPSYTFMNLLDEYPDFGRAIRDHIYLIEAFDLLTKHVENTALDLGDLKSKAQNRL